MLSFKLTFSLSSFTFIRRLYSSLLSAIKGGIICISEVIDIIPGNLDSSLCSSTLAFHMMYSAYKKKSRVTIHSLDILLSKFGASPLFHVWFQLVFLTCVEQQIGSKWEKEYIKAVYCHPAYLTYMQSTSCEMPDWVKHKLKSRLPGEISIDANMQIIPPLW